MCGILGVVRRGGEAAAAPFGAALRLLAHRGPDGTGTWTERSERADASVAFGHRRLSVVDLSAAAAQPMASRDGRLVVVYNGEIYNHVELRAELEARGAAFRSRGDTEVLLEAWRAWGPACLDRLNGMFAFAVWDREAGTLFAARDRFGEKPFHYAFDAGRGFFAFASEIKALLPFAEVDGSLDDRALYRYVAFREQAGMAETQWKGVFRLPAAHHLTLRCDGGALDVSIRRWWDLDPAARSDLSFPEAARRFAGLFADSVRLRLRSDVPVGTSLSGGLDSSAVVCQIHRLGADGGQKTFTARMDDPALDEGHHVAEVLRVTAVEGHEVWPSAAMLEDLFPALCRHMEEPFPSTSQFAQHVVMRLAAEQGVVVLLDGQGSDEMLAGYTPYFLALYAGLAEERRAGALLREWRAFRRRHGRAFPLSIRAALGRAFPGLRRVKRRLAGETPRGGRVLGAAEEWWDRGWLAEHRAEESEAPERAGRDRLSARLLFDTTRGPLQELLRYGDRNSMAYSRELRQPFLDHRIAELVQPLPSSYKIRDGESKALLREGLADLLPPAIRARQDKLGYQAPLVPWFRGPLAGWVRERLAAAGAHCGGGLVADAADRFERARPGLSDAAARQVLAVLSLAEGRRELAALRDAARLEKP